MTRFTELKLPNKILKGVGKSFSRENLRKTSGEPKGQTIKMRDGDFVELSAKGG